MKSRTHDITVRCAHGYGLRQQGRRQTMTTCLTPTPTGSPLPQKTQPGGEAPPTLAIARHNDLGRVVHTDTRQECPPHHNDAILSRREHDTEERKETKQQQSNTRTYLRLGRLFFGISCCVQHYRAPTAVVHTRRFRWCVQRNLNIICNFIFISLPAGARCEIVMFASH